LVLGLHNPLSHFGSFLVVLLLISVNEL